MVTFFVQQPYLYSINLKVPTVLKADLRNDYSSLLRSIHIEPPVVPSTNARASQATVTSTNCVAQTNELTVGTAPVTQTNEVPAP